MYIWRTFATGIVALLICMGSGSAHAVNFVCAVDANLDADFADLGETSSCVSTAGGQLCPIDSALCDQPESCPLDSSLPCASGSCERPQSCSLYFSASGNDWYRCPGTGAIILNDKAACDSACVESAACTVAPPTCPLSGGGACMDTGGGTYQCSATSCVDLDLTPPEEFNIDDRVYVDDGARDLSGLCLDTIMIFSGRNMECKKAGVDTAYQTCCKDFDMITADSTGSISEMSLYGTAISGTYQVAAAAYTAYSATGTSAAAVSAAGETALVAFDPTTLAIAIAIAVAIDYFVNNCSQQDMETGSLNASGMCYEIGEYCTKSWPFTGCVQRAKTYCCFNSKLARIIHEQGRPQLTSFSTVDVNDCRGFYPEEFQYLDFSQIDLSEYYGDLRRASETDVQGNMEGTINDFMGNVVP